MASGKSTDGETVGLRKTRPAVTTVRIASPMPSIRPGAGRRPDDQADQIARQPAPNTSTPIPSASHQLAHTVGKSLVIATSLSQRL